MAEGPAAVRAAAMRLVPLMAAAFLLAYLDKVNIGFAALQMNAALGLSPAHFGLDAGAFAIGYLVAGVPSVLLLDRFGPRRWLAVLILAWGTCSAATAFATSGTMVLVLRLLLGMAEAGFSPGVVLLFARFFPAKHRGRVLAAFFTLAPLGLVVGGPASSLLLGLDGRLGLAGWQWLFLLEAAPTLLIASLILAGLADRPRDAAWLDAEARDWLENAVAAEAPTSSATRGASLAVLADPRVWALALLYLAIGTSGIGPVFFLPLLAQSMGFSARAVGLAVALPALAACLSLPAWGWWTDRARRRAPLVATAAGMIGAGLAATAWLLPTPLSLIGLAIAMIGFFGSVAPFWTLPTDFLAGRRAALAVGAINVVGNASNFIGPFLLGRLAGTGSGYQTGLLTLAGIAVFGLLIALMLSAADLRRDTVAAGH